MTVVRDRLLANTVKGMTKDLAAAFAFTLCLLGTVMLAVPPESAALSKEGALFAKAERSFNLLKARQSRQKYRHHYENAEKLYRRVFDDYPDTEEGQKALFRCGELYTLLYRWTSGKGDLKKARSYYRRLLDEHAGGSLADDALVELAFLELNYYNDPPAAYGFFREAVDGYPKGDRTEEARLWLRKLKRYAAAAPRPAPRQGAADSAPSSSRAASLLKIADSSFADLKKKTSLQRYRHNYEKVLARYRRVFEGHPGSREAPEALLRCGELYALLYRWTSQRGDLDSARRYYQRLIQDYPASGLADDAQIAVAYLYRDLYGDKKKAYEEFEKVILLSPGGDRKPEAEKALKGLKAYRPVRSTPSTSDGGSAAVVKGIRHWSNPSYTRVVIDLDRSTNFYSHFLRESSAQGKPPRLYIDLFKSRLSESQPGSTPVNDGILLSIRAGQYKADTVRVVLDIDQLKSHQVFAMENPFRIVIDATGGGKAPSRPAPPSESLPPVASGPVTLAQQLGLGVSRVVIDPGHGAHDPGAVGVTGLREKDVVLDIALRLRNLLQREGLETILTRDKDVYLDLAERTAIANRSNSDLFVSLHANSSKRSNLRGVETYYLDIARSQRAMETAALENSMSLAKMSDLEGILAQIFNTKKDESSRLAELVQGSLVRHLGRHFTDVRDLGVKKAPFYVLIGAQMPSILAELSFINHPVEGKRLATESYRQRLAEALAAGIKSYISSVKRTAAAER